ncbi:deoxyguanosinetriphosphate triphosphohydrolase family protein [Gorillibacterium sp. sgz5001074]|uniref:deoxyguanosinetriphosphate triphosphohydrolase family protein n=1 Tax=Gorillibacterium sp. sgz5001074 TaxID=3446695 RepID=UPI003F67DE2F
MELRTLRIIGDKEGKSSDDRDEYERDYSRLIGSPAFRRLQGKSQVFGAGTGDYYRTRLTHSLEVSQIARELAGRLNRKYPGLAKETHPGLVLDKAVVEIAALAHDLGHPPFGHKGEEVLNGILLHRYGMKYEGNAQNYRILMFLEKRAGSDRGLDLTAAVLLAINKYPYSLEEPGRIKGVYGSEWAEIVKLRSLWGMPQGCATLEAQLMDLCDDIAYSTHDIEDGIRAGKIQMHEAFFHSPRLIRSLVEEIRKEEGNGRHYWSGVDVEETVRQALEAYWVQWSRILAECGGEASRARRELKAQWVGLYAGSVGLVDDSGLGWRRIAFVRDGQEDLGLLRTMEILKKLAWVTMITDFRVQRIQKRSENILEKLWEAFDDPDKAPLILPPDWNSRYERNQDKWPWPRFVADYIAGMTDAYAEKVYQELYGNRSGSIYERD